MVSGLDSSFVYSASLFLRPPMNSRIGKPWASMPPMTR